MEMEILNKILEKVGQLDHGLNSLGEQLNSLDEKVNSLGDKVASLEGKVNSLGDKVTSLDGKVASLDSKVTSLDEKVTSLDGKVASLSNEVTSLRTEMNVKFDKVDVQLSHLQESVEHIEITQQEDILSVLGFMNNRLEDTAKKSDMDSLRGDIEFIVKENSLFTLELDRLKRNGYE